MAYEHLLIFGSFIVVGWFLFICFWPRMMLYAYIAGLWVLALVIVFVLPKLRF